MANIVKYKKGGSDIRFIDIPSLADFPRRQSDRVEERTVVMALTFRQVRYFIATAELGKVSLAAVNLNVSQSAITSAIKALEEELGGQLFTRKSNGVSLTYEGHQFLQHVRSNELGID